MSEKIRGTPAVVDFFSQGYRISGLLQVSDRSLADLIYDQTVSFIVVRKAYLSPIVDPAKISAYYTTAVMTSPDTHRRRGVAPRPALHARSLPLSAQPDRAFL